MGINLVEMQIWLNLMLINMKINVNLVATKLWFLYQKVHQKNESLTKEIPDKVRIGWFSREVSESIEWKVLCC